MDKNKRDLILAEAEDFFKEFIAKKHAENVSKLTKLKAFSINPFTIHYLASFAFGDESPESIAKALVYPRALGTSIATSFGSNIQTFCHKVLGGVATVTNGMDIEFVDSLDGRKKYCQLKSGTQTINKDDVKTISDHFKSVRNLARTNHLKDFNPMTDCCVGVLYGERSELSANYKQIEEDYPVYVGAEFWYHLTGDLNFYKSLIATFSKCAKDYTETNLMKEVIDELALDIKKHPETLAYEVVTLDQEEY